MTDKKSSESRRKLLKSIAAGSGVVIAGKSLPERWAKPVVDSVILPAHAQTSEVAPIIETHSGQTEQMVQLDADNDSMFAEVIDTLVPEAKADDPATVTYDHCITPNADRTAADVVIVVTWVHENSGCTHNARYSATNVPVDFDLHSMMADWYSCEISNNGFIKITSLEGNAVGRFECGCGGLASDFDLGIGLCDLTSTQVCTSCGS